MKRINNLKIGIIKVYNTPTLPDHIVKFNKNIFVRIFRVIGGVCLLLTLSKKLFTFSESFIYFVIFIDFLFLIYQIFLIFYRIKHIYKILYTDSLDIRNSPLDKLASIFTRGLFCIKGACEGGIFFGTVLGTGIAYDWALESANKEKVFAPLVGGFITKLLGSNDLTEEQIKQLEELQIFKKNISEKMEDLRKFNDIIKSTEEVENMIQNIKTQEGIFSEEDKKLLLKGFKEEKEDLINKSLNIKQKLNIDELSKAFKNQKK